MYFLSFLLAAALQPLRILITGDMHSYYNGINKEYDPCSASDRECYGGIARIKAFLKEQKQQAIEQGKHVLSVNAGDNFTGPPSYRALGTQAVAEALKGLGIDVMVLGNHEFDHGEETLQEFLKMIDFPILASNMNFERTVHLTPERIKPYALFPEFGIAVIGITSSKRGPYGQHMEFFDMKTMRPRIEQYIQEIKAQGIDHVILLTHVGIDGDLDIAEQFSMAQLIIGGDSHTIITNRESENPFENEPVMRPFPFQHKQSLITHVFYAGTFVGVLDIDFKDKSMHVSGDTYLMDKSVPEDPKMIEQVKEWEMQLAKDRFGFASLTHELTHEFHEKIYSLYALSVRALDEWKPNHIIMLHERAFFGKLSRGPVTMMDLYRIMPYSVGVSVMTMSGKELIEVILSSQRGRNIVTGEIVYGDIHFGNLILENRNRAIIFKGGVNAYVNTRAGYEEVNIKKTYQVIITDLIKSGYTRALSKAETMTKASQDDLADILRDYLRRHDA